MNRKSAAAWTGRLIIFLSFILPVYNASAQHQNISISGTVVDATTREPLVSATVRLKNTTHQVLTDEKGGFKFLTGQVFPVTAIISYVGYNAREVTIPGEAPVTVLLEAANSKLSELTVVGYTRTRTNARNGAITSIKAEEFSKAPVTSVVEKIQGEVPGLMISANSGVPGTSVLVRLRGATSITAGNNPLYVVDGIFMNTGDMQNLGRGLGGQQPNPLAEINPEDIASITVLKDANATAIYGARGANGVILITTKRGNKNSRTRVNVSAQQGWATTPKVWDLVTGPEHAALVNVASANDGIPADKLPFRPKSQEVAGFPAYGTPEEQQTYDRLSPIFRTAQNQKYSVAVTGGDSKTNFYLGGDYEKAQSTLRLQDFTRYSFRVNLDHGISDRIKVGTSNSVSYVPRTVVRVGDGPAGLFQAALHTPVFYPLYNTDGSYYKVGVFDNVYAILNNSDNHAYALRSLNSVFASVNLLPGLTFKSTFSSDYSNYHEKAYYNTNLVYGQPAGEANDVTTTRETILAEQLFNYNKTFGKDHDLSVVLGNTLQLDWQESVSLTGTGFPSNQFKRITSAAVQTGSSSGTTSRLVSFFTGANYLFKDKYSLDVNIRADASSRFGRDHRWGYFPAVGAGWNISRESFYPSNALVSDLKLKASVGLTGNQYIGDFASRGLWNGGRNYLDQPGTGPNQPANPDLKWETTRQFNIGVGGSLLDGRITLEADYYDKYTSDLLLPAAIPVISGYSSITSNVGAMSNRGVELLVNSLNIANDHFTWKTIFTVSRNKNRVEKLVAPITDGSYGMYRIEQGHSLYSLYLWNELGVDKETGNVKIEDISGPKGVPDGKITQDDKKIVGDIWPKAEGSLRNSFSYKGFSLDVNIFYKYGNKLYNYTRYFLESGGTRGVTRSIQKSSLNYWKKPGDEGVLPRPTSLPNPDGSNNYNSATSRYMEDASYIRLKDVTLGYTLPSRLLSRWRISQANVYVTASNLFLITGYTGPDPEANSAGDTNGIVQGLDFNTTPQPRTITAGIRLTL